MPLTEDELGILKDAKALKPEQLAQLDENSRAKLNSLLSRYETDAAESRLEEVVAGKTPKPKAGHFAIMPQRVGGKDIREGEEIPGPLPKAPTGKERVEPLPSGIAGVTRSFASVSENIRDFFVRAGIERQKKFNRDWGIQMDDEQLKSVGEFFGSAGTVVGAPFSIPEFIRSAPENPRAALEGVLGVPIWTEAAKIFQEKGAEATLGFLFKRSPEIAAIAAGAESISSLGAKAAEGAAAAGKGVAAAADLSGKRAHFQKAIQDIQARAALEADPIARDAFVGQELRRIGREVDSPVLEQIGADMQKKAVAAENIAPLPKKRQAAPDEDPIAALMERRAELDRFRRALEFSAQRLTGKKGRQELRDKAMQEFTEYVNPRLQEYQKQIDDIDTELHGMGVSAKEITERGTFKPAKEPVPVAPKEPGTLVAETIGPVSDVQRQLALRPSATEIADQLLLEQANKQRRVKQAGFIGPKEETVKTVAPDDIKASNPEINRFFDETEKLKSNPFGILGQIKNAWDEKFRHLGKLKDDPFYAPGVEILRSAKEINTLAVEDSVKSVKAIYGDLSVAERELLRRHIFMRDMHHVASHPETYPGGVPRNFAPKIEVAGEPAPRTRTDISFLTQSLKESMEKVAKYPRVAEAVGRYDAIMNATRDALVARNLLTSDVMGQNVYVPHYVLHYIDQVSRNSFRIKRKGSAQDYYTDLVEVAARHLADANYRIRVYDKINQLMAKYDIAEDLAGRDPRGLTIKPGEKLKVGERMYVGRSSVFGVGRDEMASPTMSSIRDFINSVNLEDVFPGMSKAGLEEVLGRGASAKTFVIPEEISVAIDDFLQPPAKKSVMSKFTPAWKSLVINISPLRYNIRNFLGDMERGIAFIPEAFGKGMADSLREYIAYKKTGQLTPDVRAAIEHGVLQSGRTTMETLGNIRKMREMVEFLDKAPTFSAKGLLRGARRVLGSPRNFAEFREGMLRYVAYKENLNRIRAGKKPFEGISDIRGLSDPYDIASKVSREAFGDYGDFTKFEQGLRDGLIPFYSWLKINSTAWPAAVAKGYRGKGIALGALQGTRLASTLALRVAAAYWMTQKWNREMYPDAEDSLPDWQKRRPHILYEHEGKIKYFGQPSALTDFIDNFGLEEVQDNVYDLWNGRLNLKEFLSKSAMELKSVPGGVGKTLAQSVTPLIRGPAMAMGIKTFPEIGFEPPQGFAQGLGHIAGELASTTPTKVVESLTRRGTVEAAKEFFSQVAGLREFKDVDIARNYESLLRSKLADFKAEHGIYEQSFNRETRLKNDMLRAIDSGNLEDMKGAWTAVKEAKIVPGEVVKYINDRIIDKAADVPADLRREWVKSFTKFDEDMVTAVRRLAQERRNVLREFRKQIGDLKD